MSANAQPIRQWTFQSDKGVKKFTVSSEVAKLSLYFKKMIDCSENENTVILPVIEQTNDEKRVTLINTDESLEYVYKYLKIWESNPEQSNYVKEVPVQTSEIEHLLQDNDLKFIRDYIADKIRVDNITNKVPSVDAFNQTRYKIIEILSDLLCQIYDSLEIECLANKISAYIGVIIWNLSLVDFAEASIDPTFKSEQDKALQLWKSENSSRFATHINVGTISLAPISKNGVPDKKEN